MAIDMDRTYCEWSHDEISSRSDSQEVSVTQILDHGSVSFGRFEVDSLSWEKWSVFPHNRRLEEVEKFKTPGLVAQKKAYFEAYYKRIRTLKALKDQQLETTLDSEGNGIAHSHTSEEEHGVMEEENTISKLPIITNQKILHEENAEVSTERETRDHAPLLQNLEVETTVSYPDSSKRSIDEVSIEEIEQHRNEWKTIDIEDVSMNKECSMSIVEVVTSSQGILPEEMVSIEKSYSNDEPTGSHSSSRVKSNMKRFKDALSIPKGKGAASLKNPRGHKQNYIHKKPVATPAKSNQNLERKTKADVGKSLQVAKYPLHRPTGTVETGLNSNKSISGQTSTSKKLTSNSSKAYTNMAPNMSKSANCSISSKVIPKDPWRGTFISTNGSISSKSTPKDPRRGTFISTNGSISSKATPKKGPGGGTFLSTNGSISSDRPVAEVRSKVTIPRPFSFSTERRPMAPRTGEVTNNSVIDVAVNHGAKNTGFAVRRGHESVRKSTLESRYTVSKGKNVGGDKQIVRSSHISARNKSNPDGGNEHSHRHDYKNEVKYGSSLKQSRPSSKLPPSSPSTTSRTRVTKPDNKKVLSSYSLDLTRDGRKSGRGNPCWR